MGILDLAKSPPTLKFSVKADGKTVWESKPVSQGQPTQSCQIDIAGVNELQLLVWCGGDSNEGQAAWLDAQVSHDGVPASGSTVSGAWPNADTNTIGMKFVHIEPGEFDMGSPPNEVGHDMVETLHHVKITKPFMMAATTVTQAQWNAIVEKIPATSPETIIRWIRSRGMMRWHSVRSSRKEGQTLPTADRGGI